MGDLSATFTLDEAISSIGFGNFHVLALFFAGLGWASSAMGVTLLSVIGPAVKSEFRLSSSEESMLTSVMFTGTILGGFVWGYISDSFGRRYSCKSFYMLLHLSSVKKLFDIETIFIRAVTFNEILILYKCLMSRILILYATFISVQLRKFDFD
ncbi:hypothetical protein Leryth_019784, partial [Lithospermum erythrorhizon]